MFKYNRDEYKDYLKHGVIGIDLFIRLSFPILIGYWLDKEYSDNIFFLIIGFIIGILSSSIKLYFFTKNYVLTNKSNKNETKRFKK